MNFGTYWLKMDNVRLKLFISCCALQQLFKPPQCTAFSWLLYLYKYQVAYDNFSNKQATEVFPWVLAEAPHQQLPAVPPRSQLSTTTPPAVSVCIASNTSLRCVRFPARLASQETTWLLRTTENCINNKPFSFPIYLFSQHTEKSLWVLDIIVPNLGYEVQQGHLASVTPKYFSVISARMRDRTARLILPLGCTAFTQPPSQSILFPTFLPRKRCFARATPSTIKLNYLVKLKASLLILWHSKEEERRKPHSSACIFTEVTWH